MKPAPARPSKRAMLRLDPTTIPDPSKPQKWDAYGTAPGRHELVITLTYYNDVNDCMSVHMFLGGEDKDHSIDMFQEFIASAGLVPTGRMTLEPAPVVESRPESRTPGEIAAWREGVEVGRREALDPVDGGICETENRITAQRMGPALRRLRTFHRVSLGALARSLGCQTAALSAFELGERPGDRANAPSTALWDRTLHPAGKCTCGAGGIGKCDWCVMDMARGYDDAEAEAAVAADRAASLDHLRATGEARDNLADLLATQVLTCPGVRAAMLVALHDAIKSPEAGEAMAVQAAQAAPRGHEVDITAQVEQGVMVGLIQEAINLLESAIATDDQQHVGECIGDARKMLYKSIEPVAE